MPKSIPDPLSPSPLPFPSNPVPSISSLLAVHNSFTIFVKNQLPMYESRQNVKIHVKNNAKIDTKLNVIRCRACRSGHRPHVLHSFARCLRPSPHAPQNPRLSDRSASLASGRRTLHCLPIRSPRAVAKDTFGHLRTLCTAPMTLFDT